ncbi:hypothetical protein [Paenibacillus sp. FSL H3-0333]|uniref:hypothetical protein n=1 Tax=Paenibacillus sp. FSL H3-0333 TaxID=2921373 RepID=UPI0030FCD6D6
MFFVADILDKNDYGITIEYKDGESLVLLGKDDENKKINQVRIRKETLPAITQLLMAANYCIENNISVHVDYIVEVVGHDIIGGYLALLTEEDAYKALNIDPSRRERNEFEAVLIAPPYNGGTFRGIYVGNKVKLNYSNFLPFNADYEVEPPEPDEY